MAQLGPSSTCDPSTVNLDPLALHLQHPMSNLSLKWTVILNLTTKISSEDKSSLFLFVAVDESKAALIKPALLIHAFTTSWLDYLYLATPSGREPQSTKEGPNHTDPG